MSTTFWPQTDGQTKRVNLVLQDCLRKYANADQIDWADHISMAEFSYIILNIRERGLTCSWWFSERNHYLL